MAYEYIKRTYKFQPEIGRRVKHTVTKNEGVIAREDRSAGHYVQVRFDGRRFVSPCHPDELEYTERNPGTDPKTGEYSTAQMLHDEIYGGDTSRPLFD